MEKKKNDWKVDKLRAIMLFEAAFNKNNKKQQSKSIRTRASTKSHKHHRKSFTLKNVK